MHRGSSKDPGPAGPGPEHLPLSASLSVTVSLAVARGGAPVPRSLQLPVGARVRDAVRAVGLAPEGAAVLVEERPVPLDGPLTDGMSLVVVPTYSGG